MRSGTSGKRKRRCAAGKTVGRENIHGRVWEKIAAAVTRDVRQP